MSTSFATWEIRDLVSLFNCISESADLTQYPDRERGGKCPCWLWTFITPSTFKQKLWNLATLTKSSLEQFGMAGYCVKKNMTGTFVMASPEIRSEQERKFFISGGMTLSRIVQSTQCPDFGRLSWTNKNVCAKLLFPVSFQPPVPLGRPDTHIRPHYLSFWFPVSSTVTTRNSGSKKVLM